MIQLSDIMKESNVFVYFIIVFNNSRDTVKLVIF